LDQRLVGGEHQRHVDLNRSSRALGVVEQVRQSARQINPPIDVVLDLLNRTIEELGMDGQQFVETLRTATSSTLSPAKEPGRPFRSPGFVASWCRSSGRWQ
jgi:hypothetical protein